MLHSMLRQNRNKKSEIREITFLKIQKILFLKFLPDIAAVAEVGLGAFGGDNPVGIECFKYSFTLDEGGSIFIKVSKMAGSLLLKSLSLDFVEGTEKMMFLS